MDRKQKLELTWIGKYDEIKVEPRILLEDKSKGYGDPNTENMLIHGDNLLALKALEQDFAGKIKCIYIDPPYNTGSAFAHYDDNLEHSTWLNLMKPRLEIIHNLLADDGSLWISIDDDECHYLKVLCDEIFGRKNFITSVIWQKKYAPQNDAVYFSDTHDFILVYAKNKKGMSGSNNYWQINKLARTEQQNSLYKNPDNDPRGPWMSDNLSVKTPNPRDIYPIISPSGKIFMPPESRSWVVSKEKFDELLKDNRIWFGKSGNNSPRLKRFLSEVQGGAVPKTIWFREEVGDNQEAKREVKAFNNDDVFTTPKPERLIQRILTLATNSGDWVLDSFLGSGTTAAVAHKMGRRWIGIELGDHCYTHCLPRLKAVVDGEQGGISKAVNWQGGGGFRFFELAPSLLKKDKYGNWIIDECYNADMLAAAMAKHQGFTYAPDSEVFWKQGYSFEKDYIFTTTQFVTLEYLDLIHQEMAGDESLLICCKAFQDGADQRYENINVKKIPQVLLNKCDFGVESYSLNIVGLPEIDEEVDDNE